MLPSEKRSLYRFMMIYVTTTLLLLGIGSVMLYRFEFYQIEENARKSLKKQSDSLLPLIKEIQLDKLRRFKDLKIAVYNGKKEYIFGTFKPSSLTWGNHFESSGDILRYNRFIPPPHRKHTAFMVLEKKIDRSAIESLKQSMLYAGVLALLIVLGLGYFLGRLFIAPMREALDKINLFVQDTTHELNTPISTILTNIEMMELLGKCKGNKELKRIEIASKTLSQIYSGLSYLKLNATQKREPEKLNLTEMLQERVTYFSSLAEAKELNVTKQVGHDVTLFIDHSDAIRLIDNLLSNAIKYNNIGGDIRIVLDENHLSISDTGRGMHKEMSQKVFERFSRADESEGGFGIGLDIVSEVVQYYGYDITLNSVPEEGTTVSIFW